MPLTVLQKQVLRVLAANRSEESHFAGGLVLNAGEGSPRYSHDFDIFHEAEAEVARASDLDVDSLRSAGYEVHQIGGDWKNPVSFRKAKLIHAGEELEIDTAADCAFRLFSIEADAALGWQAVVEWVGGRIGVEPRRESLRFRSWAKVGSGGGLVEPGLDGFDGPGLDGLVPVVVDLPEESGIRMYLEGEGGAGQSVVPGLPVGLRGR